jgi:hypothetical protein
MKKSMTVSPASASERQTDDPTAGGLRARRADGIHLAPFEQGEIGPDYSRPPAI